MKLKIYVSSISILFFITFVLCVFMKLYGIPSETILIIGELVSGIGAVIISLIVLCTAYWF